MDNCPNCNGSGSVPASATTLVMGADDDGYEECDCASAPWNPDFGPLEKYLSRNPHQTGLPWEYVGHDEKGNAHYREREANNRLCLNLNGRYARIHAVRDDGSVYAIGD